MAVIDEKGRLFGVVNVVDAIVVLVLAAVVLAGIALVVGGDDAGEPGDSSDPNRTEETRYATLSYNAPLGSAAAVVENGTALVPREGGETLVVEDAYRSFTPGGDAHVVARVAYEGDLETGGAVRYGGDTIEVRTDAAAVTADVLAVNQSERTIPTRTERVVLIANVSTAAANGIEPDASATIGDTEVARVTAVERGTSADGRTRVAVGATVTVWDREPVAAFDGRSLRLGNRLTIVTDRVAIPGEVAAIGTEDPATVDE